MNDFHFDFFDNNIRPSYPIALNKFKDYINELIAAQRLKKYPVKAVYDEHTNKVHLVFGEDYSAGVRREIVYYLFSHQRLVMKIAYICATGQIITNYSTHMGYLHPNISARDRRVNFIQKNESFYLANQETVNEPNLLTTLKLRFNFLIIENDHLDQMNTFFNAKGEWTNNWKDIIYYPGSHALELPKFGMPKLEQLKQYIQTVLQTHNISDVLVKLQYPNIFFVPRSDLITEEQFLARMDLILRVFNFTIWFSNLLSHNETRSVSDMKKNYFFNIETHEVIKALYEFPLYEDTVLQPGSSVEECFQYSLEMRAREGLSNLSSIFSSYSSAPQSQPMSRELEALLNDHPSPHDYVDAVPAAREETSSSTSTSSHSSADSSSSTSSSHSASVVTEPSEIDSSRDPQLFERIQNKFVKLVYDPHKRTLTQKRKVVTTAALVNFINSKIDSNPNLIGRLLAQISAEDKDVILLSFTTRWGVIGTRNIVFDVFGTKFNIIHSYGDIHYSVKDKVITVQRDKNAPLSPETFQVNFNAFMAANHIEGKVNIKRTSLYLADNIDFNTVVNELKYICQFRTDETPSEIELSHMQGNLSSAQQGNRDKEIDRINFIVMDAAVEEKIVGYYTDAISNKKNKTGSETSAPRNSGTFFPQTSQPTTTPGPIQQVANQGNLVIDSNPGLAAFMRNFTG